MNSGSGKSRYFLFIIFGALFLIFSVACGKAKSDKDAAEIKKLTVLEDQTEVRLFKTVRPIELSGYDDNAMEPEISPSGETLFFNNSNATGVHSKLHYAVRKSDCLFQYQGDLKGTFSDTKDLAPAIDENNNFYFTSLREYGKSSLRTLFKGTFAGDDVSGVHALDGNVASTIPGWLNMDCDVSADGKLFIYSMARFRAGEHIPRQSNLIIAEIVDGKAVQNKDSDFYLKRINTDELEYAPAISKGGLELYFTRATIAQEGQDRSNNLVRIMVATRDSLKEPFSKPRKVAGFGNEKDVVEGVTTTADGKTLYFHKLVDGVYKIFVATDRIDAGASSEKPH